jgi:aldehyde:ferredoxin oxidoreductase
MARKKEKEIGGYTGKVLRLDLSAKKINVEETDWETARSFIGGRGYAAKVLFDELSAGIDPLGPRNKIVLGTGPVTGTPVSGASRAVLVTKSPETNFFLDSYSGGFFPAETKFAGYDFIILEGRAERPSYISIHDEKVEIKDAAHLWGKSTYETANVLKKESGDGRSCVAVIGPAGERLSNLAMVENDYSHEFGRGGTGAVWGSKNLKALVVRGSRAVKVAHPEVLLPYLLDVVEKKVSARLPKGVLADRMKYGTPLTLSFTNASGILPTRNFRFGEFEGAAKIDCHAFRERVIADTACYGCTIGCTKHSRSMTGASAGMTVGGPEYETMGMFGSNLAVDDFDKIIYANVLCDDLGLDTIGAGNVIGWAMECYERGILSKKDLNGLDLKFGNFAAIIRMIRMIAFREGIGDLLAQGVKKAAEAVGQGSEAFSMHAKGLEYPAYRPGPRSPAFGLVYAIVERGACHRRAWPVLAEQELEPYTIRGRAKLIKNLYDQRIPWHCACTCDMAVLLPGLDHQDAANLLSAITGWEYTPQEMQNLCERVASLIRVFNIREGASRRDDTLAPRSFQPDERGPAQGKALTPAMLDAMLDEYYALRGWTKEGVPTAGTLQNLGLGDVAQELERVLR